MNAKRARTLRMLCQTYEDNRTRRRYYQIVKRLWTELPNPEKTNRSYTSLLENAKKILAHKLQQEMLRSQNA